MKVFDRIDLINQFRAKEGSWALNSYVQFRAGIGQRRRFGVDLKRLQWLNFLGDKGILQEDGKRFEIVVKEERQIRRDSERVAKNSTY